MTQHKSKPQQKNCKNNFFFIVWPIQNVTEVSVKPSVDLFLVFIHQRW